MFHSKLSIICGILCGIGKINILCPISDFIIYATGCMIALSWDFIVVNRRENILAYIPPNITDICINQNEITAVT